MQKPAAALLLCLLGFPSAVLAGDNSAASTDTLTFTNKDVLHGTFLGCDPAGLRWQSAASKEPLIFQTADIAGAELGLRKPPSDMIPPTHSILLLNGDELAGVPISLDEKALLLDTWYAGKLAIPRSMIKGIVRLNESNTVLYQGPGSAREWTADEGEALDDHDRSLSNWTYKNGVLTATEYGGIRRDMKLPACADIGFDLTMIAGVSDQSKFALLTWRKPALTVPTEEPELDVHIYGENSEQPINDYLFRFTLIGVDLHRISDGKSQEMDRPVNLPLDAQPGKTVRVNIRANKDTHTLWLFANGKQVGQWTDIAGFAGTGTSLMFTSQLDSGFIKISHIAINAWDGKIDGRDVVTVKSTEGISTQDIIRMENKDAISGKLKGIANGKVLFHSSYNDITVPFEHIQQIDFATGDAAPVQPKAGDVRAYFAGRGSVTLALKSWNGKRVAVTSPDFGDALLSTDAIQRFQFNPGDPTPPPSDVAADTGDDDGNALSGENAELADKPNSAMTDTLVFANKDILHGTLLSCDKTTVQWQSLSAKSPFLFQTACLDEVRLDSHKAPIGSTPHTHSVALASGDEIPGVLFSLDDKTLLLDTWYAGRLAIPRSAVKSIRQLNDQKTVVYQGPVSMAGWTVVQNNQDEDGIKRRKDDWDCRGGALISTGLDQIVHHIQLPPRASVEFDLYMANGGSEWANTGFAVWIYDHNPGHISNGYYFNIGLDNHGSAIRLMRSVQNGKTHQMGEKLFFPEGATSRRNIHVDIRLDRDAKKIWLLLDGDLAGQWIDNEGVVCADTDLMFDSENATGTYTKVSNIKISEWNGKLNNPPSPLVNKLKAGEDSLIMENQDNLSGKLKSIADGKALFTASGSDLPISLEHVVQINISPGQSNQRESASKNIRAWLTEGGSVAMDLQAWNNKQVIATSPDFGNAIFSPDAFQKLQFNANRRSTVLDGSAH